MTRVYSDQKIHYPFFLPGKFNSEEELASAWHTQFQKLNPDWLNIPLYMDGGLDDIPSELWYDYLLWGD